jgi:SAM-dependent methyltransferase
MAHRVCPWWLGYLLVSPLRRLLQNPTTLLGPHVAEGMTVLEPGPGMGFFTLDLARLVGPRGRVVAVELQPRMAEALRRRALQAGVADRIEVRLAERESLGATDLVGKVDVVVAFAVVHELPSPARFFAEAAAALKPGGRLLLAEPSGHVSGADFEGELATAADAGLVVSARPEVWRSRSAVLVRR